MPPTAKADACGAVGTLPDTPETTEFYGGNVMLGPEALPTDGPVGKLISAGYQRFGAVDADTFKKDYIVERPDGTYWNWPPADGFAFKDGQPDRHRRTLEPGQQIDRFGFAVGQFLAPKDTPFAQRALPPQALETPNHQMRDYEGNIGTANIIIPPSNYHAYCVQNAFDVEAGPIAPWFGQEGFGDQYMLVADYVPDFRPDRPKDKLSVQWLLSHGPASGGRYLVEQRP